MIRPKIFQATKNSSNKLGCQAYFDNIIIHKLRIKAQFDYCFCRSQSGAGLRMQVHTQALNHSTVTMMAEASFQFVMILQQLL